MKKWELKEDQIYWAILLDDAGIYAEEYVFYSNVDGCLLDKELGNCFRTKKDAEKMIKKIKRLLGK